MKKTLFLLATVFLSFNIVNAQETATEINWMSLEEAIEAQKETPKKIFMDVYTQWCGPCKMLDKNTFHHADVVKYVNDHFYAVKFDAESPTPITYKGKIYSNPTYVEGKKGRNGVHELSRQFQVSAYPTMLFLNENTDVITPVTGYLQPTQLELYLKLIHQEDYKLLTTDDAWTKYQESFVPTFK